MSKTIVAGLGILAIAIAIALGMAVVGSEPGLDLILGEPEFTLGPVIEMVQELER